MPYIIGWVDIEDGVDTGLVANDKIADAFANTQSAVNFIDIRVTTIEDILDSISLNVLNASSVAADQKPGVADTPLQVEYGAIQGDGLDPVMIDALGTITFNTAGTYNASVVITYGKDVDTEVAKLYTRFVKNTTQLGDTGVIAIDDGDLISLHYSFTIVALSGDILKTWIARTGLGVAGLFKSTFSDWNDVPSATIHLAKVA